MQERLWDWFVEKYEGQCYLKALKEFNSTHSWWRRSWGFKEKDRIWLIQRTKDILKELWRDKLTNENN